jgi:hypothetical protein
MRWRRLWRRQLSAKRDGSENEVKYLNLLTLLLLLLLNIVTR